MVHSIDVYLHTTLSQTVDLKLKSNLAISAEMKMSIIKDHAQLSNLDYEHSGHTGFVSVVMFNEELFKKVDKINGKKLSTEDYTTEDKEKLDNIDHITRDEIINILNH